MAKPQDTDAFMAELDHPAKAEIEAVRRVIMTADPAISEGIKWNAPSFFYGDWFATFHLRAKGGVQIILHRGAKVRDYDGTIEDPDGLLAWLAKDRATVKFSDMADIEAKSAGFTAIVRQWVAQM